MEVGANSHTRYSGFPVSYFCLGLVYSLSVTTEEVCDAPIMPMPRAVQFSPAISGFSWYTPWKIAGGSVREYVKQSVYEHHVESGHPND